MNNEKIGMRIKKIRKELKLNQKEFGEKIYIKGASVGHIEIGKNNPSLQTLKLIEKIFNVNPEYLQTGKGEIFTTEKELIKKIENTEKTESKLIVPLIKNLSKLSDAEILAVEKMLNQLLDAYENYRPHDNNNDEKL